MIDDGNCYQPFKYEDARFLETKLLIRYAVPAPDRESWWTTLREIKTTDVHLIDGREGGT